MPAAQSALPQSTSRARAGHGRQHTQCPFWGGGDPNLAGRQRNGMPIFDVNGQNGGLT
jgi:hypothetical protein